MRKANPVSERLFSEFIASDDNLWVYHRGELIFSSSEDGLTPLVDYLARFVPRVRGVLVFDRIVGNAAALLLKKASCRELWSPVGSELAAQTLEGFGIQYYFATKVPYISNRQGDGLCPFEKLSQGKTPEEFYGLVRKVLAR